MIRLFSRLFLYISDKILKKCLWKHFYNPQIQQSKSPTWLNQLFSCHCEQAIQPYLSDEAEYHDYLIQSSFLSCVEKRQIQRTVKYWHYQPLISIQMAVYKVELSHLQACLDSVAQQLYPHWQLCIVEDGSGREDIKTCLQQFKQQFPHKVKLVLRDNNKGITETSKEAFELTSGDYIALLDHDDRLAPEALFKVAEQLNQDPKIDWLYSENDKIDQNNKRCCRHTKPAWSPELLLTYNYILHLSVIRRDLIQKAGGFRAGFEGSQDHDLYLRLSELTDHIYFIPRILYSWRQTENSVALNPASKDYAYQAALRALDAALKRRGEVGKAIHPDYSWLGSYRLIRQISKPIINVIFNCYQAEQSKITDLLHQQQAIKIQQVFWLKEKQSIKNGILENIKQCQAPYILFLSPQLLFQNALQLNQMAQNLVPEKVALCTGKIINNQQVDHCGLSYQQGHIQYPLRDWEETLDGAGAAGALPRNISLTSPLISLCKTQIIKNIINKIADYQNLDAFFIALSLTLLKEQNRLCADGYIALVNTQSSYYKVELTEQDKTQLIKDFPFFGKTKDPYIHKHIL